MFFDIALEQWHFIGADHFLLPVELQPPDPPGISMPILAPSQVLVI